LIKVTFACIDYLVVKGFNNLEIETEIDDPEKNLWIRDSQITLKNESSFIDPNDESIQDLTPNASQNVIPRFFNPFGKHVHTKSLCDNIIVR
jgi:hypothetical protein